MAPQYSFFQLVGQFVGLLPVVFCLLNNLDGVFCGEAVLSFEIAQLIRLFCGYFFTI